MAIDNEDLLARIQFILPKKEKELLKKYCEANARNYTDLLREYIRSLKA
jgi:hypothetical protein